MHPLLEHDQLHPLADTVGPDHRDEREHGLTTFKVELQLLATTPGVDMAPEGRGPEVEETCDVLRDVLRDGEAGSPVLLAFIVVEPDRPFAVKEAREVLVLGARKGVGDGG